MNVRTYVNDPGNAATEMQRIIELLDSQAVEPFVYFDTETSPKRGLTAYPTTLSGALNITPVNHNHYKLWILWVMYRDFDIEKLETLGIRAPVKPGTTKKRFYTDANLYLTGKRANLLWETFCENVLANQEGCRAAFKDDAELYDIRYWFHAVKIILERRSPDADPVQPGLRPNDSDVFIYQITLVARESSQKFSWAFNVMKVDIQILKPLFQRTTEMFIAHNAKFDIALTADVLGWQNVTQNVTCTQVIDTILTLGLNTSHSLAFCANKYLSLELGKETRATFIGVRKDELTDDQLEYVFTDTEILPDLFEKQMRAANWAGQKTIAIDFGRLSWIAAFWEQQGYLVDANKWLENVATAVHQRDFWAGKCEKMLLGDAYFENLGLPQPDDTSVVEETEDEEVDIRPNAVVKMTQRDLVAELAMKMLGLESEELKDEWKNKKGIMRLNKDYRNVIAAYHTEKTGQPHEFFEAYAKWSGYSALFQKYGPNFLHYIHPVSGRIHPTFRVAGTTTARFASSRPNMLNQPTDKFGLGIDTRSAFIAPEGYNLGGADFSNQEARIDAIWTGDPILMEAFKRREDVHSVIGALAFHMRKADIDVPTKVTEPFRRGALVVNIDIWELPRDTTDEEMLKLAFTPDVLNLVIRKLTRDLAKTTGFLVSFGGGATALSLKANIPLAQAQDIFSVYGSVLSVKMSESRRLGALPLYEQVVIKEAGTPRERRVGYSEARGNLRRYFHLPKAPSPYSFDMTTEEGKLEFQEATDKFRRQRAAIQREGYNQLTQGGGAVVTTYSLLELQKDMFETGIIPYLAIYDEIRTLVRDDVPYETYKEVLEKTMVDAWDKYYPELEMPVDAEPLLPYWKKGE